MADEEFFVDTAADTGGNGTTRNHSSGDSSHAFKSYAAFESVHGGTNLVSETITMRVRMAGSIADGLIDQGSAWTANVDFFLTIEADDAAPDNDGFYTGPFVWSASHYRVETATGFRAIRLREQFTQLIGIQFQCTKNNSSASGVDIQAGSILIDKCSVTAEGKLTRAGIDFNTTIAAVSGVATNNIVFDIGGSGIRTGSTAAGSSTFDHYNNTIFACGKGLSYGTDEASLTANNINNAIFDCAPDLDDPVNLVDNVDTNAREDAAVTGETNRIVIGTLTDAMVTPGGTMKSRDVTPKSESSTLFEAGIGRDANSTVPLLDRFGITRDITSPSIGAIELLSVGVDTVPEHITLHNRNNPNPIRLM